MSPKGPICRVLPPLPELLIVKVKSPVTYELSKLQFLPLILTIVSSFDKTKRLNAPPLPPPNRGGDFGWHMTSPLIIWPE